MNDKAFFGHLAIVRVLKHPDLLSRDKRNGGLRLYRTSADSRALIANSHVELYTGTFIQYALHTI